MRSASHKENLAFIPLAQLYIQESICCCETGFPGANALEKAERCCEKGAASEGTRERASEEKPV